MIGSAYHETIAQAFRYKLLDGKEWREEAEQFFADQLVADASRNGLTDVWPHVLSGRAMVALYLSKALHEADPLMIEVEFHQPLNERVELSGRIDLVTKTHVIVDHKTSSFEYDPEALRWDIQPRLYAWAYEAMTGDRMEAFSYHVMLKSSPPRLQRITIPRFSDEEIEWHRRLAIEVGDAVASHSFPRRASERTCSSCYYRGECRSWPH